TLPNALRRAPVDDGDDEAEEIAFPRREKRKRKLTSRAPLTLDPGDEDQPRKSPEISDPRQPPRPAGPLKATQKDLFDSLDLPSLDLLEDPPLDRGPRLDKAALESNARLLESVLDDFNVKGEITAVRAGPV